jgi:hypothetical protein
LAQLALLMDSPAFVDGVFDRRHWSLCSFSPQPQAQVPEAVANCKPSVEIAGGGKVAYRRAYARLASRRHGETTWKQHR